MKLPLINLAAITCLACAPAVFAQGQQSQQQSQQSQQQTTAPQQTSKPSLANPLQDVFPPTPPPVDPKEEAAYKAFFEMKPATPAENDAQIKAGEDFIKNYPKSRYLEAVYSRLTNAYLDKNDSDNMCDAADKALALNPNDLTVLIPVGEAIPRSDPKSPKFVERLGKAEQYEQHALEILKTVIKPSALTDAQFTEVKNNASAEAHSGLGLIYFDEKKYDLSSTELQSATGGSPTLQATNEFVLGLDFVNLQKYPDAIKAFDTCSQISSPLQDRCKKASGDAKAREGAAPKP